MKNDLSSWPMHNSPYLNSNINPVAIAESRDKRILNKLLSHKHMIETIERFTWSELPPGLNSDLIERVLYFRYKGAFFRFNDRFYFLPLTLKGDIDSYGRYIGITPVLFTGQWKIKDNKIIEDISFMSGLEYPVLYDKEFVDQTKDMAIILTDSSLEISQDYTPMQYMIRPLIEQLTDILVLVNMDLINSAKVYTIVARDEDQKLAIEAEFENLDRKILSGRRVVVVTADTNLQELIGSSSKDSARYFQSFQSIDNLRKSIIGIENGGTFMKQEHMTDMETEVNSSGGDAVLNNALRMRKEFAELVNAQYGLNISVEINASYTEPIVAEQGEHTKAQEGGEDDE